MIAKEIALLTGEIGNVSAVCSALGMNRSTYYRHLQEPTRPLERKKGLSHRALTEEEFQAIADVLHEIRFVDKAPAEIYAALLDEGRYIGSVSTMYRVLRGLKEIQERRNISRHHNYEKPELIATGPNQVWSWDITKLKGPSKGIYFYLYAIIDIYSRCTVGWLVANREKAEIAKHLIEETCERQGVNRAKLTIHSDRGSSMNSKLVADLLIELGVTKSLNRPHVSNDNPFSESQFKTLKYRPEFPRRFGCIEDAISLCSRFFQWYNNDHYHSGIKFLKPSAVHYGFGSDCLKKRHEVLQQAYENQPHRFVNGAPKPVVLPEAVWINPPATPATVEISEVTVCSGTIIGDVR
ncbi:MAG: IS3 family transposase [Candidatus Melainabacteria bacterium]|nr:IS3 family transposase [Candidatus Melainabacteria bacterium]